ncbi:MAG: hypothetical protein AAB526_00935 [Patescibacteria group bacterium]
MQKILIKWWPLIIVLILFFVFLAQLMNLFFLESVKSANSSEKILFSKKMNIALQLNQSLDKNILLEFNAISKQIIKKKEILIKEPIRINKQNLKINVTAQSGLVVDLKTGKKLWEKNFQEKRSIASLTKLMSALIFLETNPSLEKKIKITKKDEIGGARLNVNFSEDILVNDLFHAGLIGSKNNAILALARFTGMSKENFVKKMNKKAQVIGLKNTHFVDPSGLDSKNLSTAEDVLKLAKQVFKNQEIKKILVTNKYQFFTFLNNKKARAIVVENTNELLSKLKIEAGKTGFSNEAGSCLVIQIKNEYGNEILAVLLGNKTKEINFQEMEKLIKWIFENYKWQE